MTSTVETVSDLIDRLSIRDQCPAMLAIDGALGSGKTTLAEALVDSIGGRIVHLDDYVTPDSGAYVANIRQDDLLATLSPGQRPIVVEGVCILHALAMIDTSPDALIYVKHVGSNGIWLDEEECDAPGSPATIIADLDAQVRAFESAVADLGRPDPQGLTWLRQEVIWYHHEYGPHSKAEIVFRNTTA